MGDENPKKKRKIVARERSALLGKKFVKDFGSFGLYEGVIIRDDGEAGLMVRYQADCDSEHVQEEALQQLLRDSSQYEGGSQRIKRMREDENQEKTEKSSQATQKKQVNKTKTKTETKGSYLEGPSFNAQLEYALSESWKDSWAPQVHISFNDQVHKMTPHHLSLY